MKMFFRSLSLVITALVAACGGGGGGDPTAVGDQAATAAAAALGSPAPDPQAPTAAALALRRAPSCDYAHISLTVRSLRLRLQDRSGETWHDIGLAQPRQLDLLHMSSGVFEALRAAPLPAGRYLEVRLMLASEPMTNTIQAADGAPMPLSVPGGAENGVKLTGDFEVPPSESADVLLDGFDPCRNVIQAGSQGAYQLIPAMPGRLALLDSDQEHRIDGDQVNALSGGGFAVSAFDADGATVQRYGAQGRFSGAEVRITGPYFSSLTPLAGGDYLLMWGLPPLEGPGLPTQANRLMLQLYDAAGAPLGVAVQPGLVYPIWFSHTYPGTVPTAAALTAGGFAALWRDMSSHYLLVYKPDGTPLGLPQALQLTSPARVVALASGGFLIASGLTSIVATAYSADGTAVGPAQLVGATQWSGLSTWTDFAASPLAGGGAVVVWATEVDRYSGATPTLNVRRLAADGSALGEAFSAGDVDRGPPSVAGLDDGGFVVSWLLQGHVYAERFAGDGTPAGAVTRIDAITSSPSDVSVVPTGMGGFLVSWNGIGADGLTARYGRLFGADSLSN